MTPVSPYWEIQVVDENDPKEWLHMNTECQIVTGETSKCTVVSWNAQYICGAIALGYIVSVASEVGNRFPTKVSSNTKEKEALFVWGKLECIDQTKETTIVCEFLLTVDSLQNWLQKVTPVSPYWEIQVVDENDPNEWLHMNTEWHIVTGETSKCTVVSWNALYVCGAIALGYIVTVAPKVRNRFPTKVSSKTNEKDAVFGSGNI